MTLRVVAPFSVTPINSRAQHAMGEGGTGKRRKRTTIDTDRGAWYHEAAIREAKKDADAKGTGD